MVKISIKEAQETILRLRTKMSSSKVARAERMAINTTIRRTRPKIVKEIRRRYNIPIKRIYDRDRRKGLKEVFATDSNLRGTITGGHLPVNFASLDGTKLVTGADKTRLRAATLLRRRAEGKSPLEKLFVSVEIIRGQRKTIKTAFVLGVTPGQKGAKFTGDKPAIFARGIYGKPSFEHGKPRLPISSLSTSSVATAASIKDVREKWEPEARRLAGAEMIRQIQRLAK